MLLIVLMLWMGMMFGWLRFVVVVVLIWNFLIFFFVVNCLDNIIFSVMLWFKLIWWVLKIMFILFWVSLYLILYFGIIGSCMDLFVLFLVSLVEFLGVVVWLSLFFVCGKMVGWLLLVRVGELEDLILCCVVLKRYLG